MNRPTGVTVIAVLFFIGACFATLLAIAFLVGGGLAAKFMPPDARIPAGIMAAVGGIAAIVILVFAALYIAIGVGLLKLKEWARITAVVLAGLSLLFGLLGLLHFHPFALIRLAIAGWILWYLLQPHVVAIFRGTSAPPMMAPPVPPPAR
jgi:uncharacterized membrane protein (DUF2068 family)